MPTTVRTARSLDMEVRVRDGVLPSDETLARVASADPPLRSLTLVFEGADPRTVDRVVELDRQLRRAAGAFSVDFLLDRETDVGAALAGQDNGLRPVLAMSRMLRGRGVAVRWRVDPVDGLVYRLESIFSLAADENVDAVIAPTNRAARLDEDGRRFVADFIAYRLLEQAPAYYKALLSWFESGGTAACPEFGSTTVMERSVDGQWTTHQEPICAPSAALPGHADLRLAHAPSLADLTEVLGEGTRALAAWAFTAARGAASSPAVRDAERSLPSVLVIGAYGGDHIGDTAILGGVLLRMHRRYGTSRAVVVSQRPAHTRRLVAMLDVPVVVTVEEYRLPVVASWVTRVDAVVFAGGPLMDLPKQLVKHLYTVSLARRHGRPFIIEGIGAGPFIRRVSAWTARLFVRMAERITVRTAVDARRPLVRGLQPIAGRDPAFDYLDTRNAALTRLPDADRAWLDRLLDDASGRAIVAINLRPLRPDYTVGRSADDRVQYTRLVETRFEERLAEALRRFHQASPEPPCFIFFPMNSIQFGSSDLRSAYRLKRLVGGDIDLRVWEGDPSIDGIVALLRRVDLAITMRFHATIYALSQGLAVIGVDYRPGKKDKVAALLDDAGQGQNCARIDEITTEWLVDRLSALTASRSSRSTFRPVPRRVAT